MNAPLPTPLLAALTVLHVAITLLITRLRGVKALCSVRRAITSFIFITR